MRIFIQEYASGGGLIKENLNANLLVEGFGILRVLIDNCNRLGYKIETTLDKRLSFLMKFLQTDNITLLSQNESILESSLEILNKCDLGLIIAPGTAGILSVFNDTYSKSSAEILNCKTSAIDFATNKSLAYQHCSERNIKFPKTRVLQENGSCFEISEEIKMKKLSNIDKIENWDLVFPILIKPNDGVACEGISLCSTITELNEKLQGNSGKTILIQDFIYGDHLSVLIYVHENNLHFISINEQILAIGNDKSEYLGGISNIHCSYTDLILSFCKRVLEDIAGLKGFIGIDLIASPKADGSKELYFIEINPRVTTPICGLVKANTKPINLLPKNITPFSPNQKDITYFSKAKFYFPIILKHRIYSKIINDPTIVTPPISFDNQIIYSLIRGSANNPRKANRNFNKNLIALSNTLKKEFLSK